MLDVATRNCHSLTLMPEVRAGNARRTGPILKNGKTWTSNSQRWENMDVRLLKMGKHGRPTLKDGKTWTSNSQRWETGTSNSQRWETWTSNSQRRETWTSNSQRREIMDVQLSNMGNH